MSFIGRNIKKIRAIKKMSQSEFAQKFDLARPSIGAYEEGRTEPRIETIIQIAKYFEISIDTLLTKELTVNELYKFDIFKKELTKDELPAVDKDDIKEHSPLVTMDNEIDYIVNHRSKDFVNNLPLIQFPYTKTKKSRAFQINGSEMEHENCGLHHKDILLCSPVSDRKNLKEDHVYVIVTEKQVIARRLKEVGEKLIFKCDNSAYDDVILSQEDILELWLTDAYFSSNLKSPTLIDKRMTQLEKKFEKLESMLNKKA